MSTPLSQAPLSSSLDERIPALARAGLVLGPLFFLALLLWPGLALEPAQRRTAAVAAWTATWWLTSAQPVGATSLLPAALLPVLGVMDAKTVAPFYMGDLVMLFLGAFLLTRGLERWNVHRRMALAVLTIVGTRPRRLVLGMMCATAGISLFVNNTSTTLLMLPIALALLTSFEGPERSAFARALLLGVAYSASVGGIATPVGTAPNQIFLGQFRKSFPDAPEISFVQWALAWLPVVLLYLPIGWLLLTRVLFRVPREASLGPASGRDVLAEERRALGPWRTGEKRMAALFALAALAWLTRADLELGAIRLEGWGDLLKGSLDKSPVSDATVAVLLALVAFLVPSGERGQPLLDWSTARALPWDVLLLFGGGFALAGAVDASGLDEVVGGALAPWVANQPDWLIVLGIVLLVTAFSELASNVATTQVMLPIVGQAAVAAGLSPLLTMLPATIAASNGFMLPVATPPNAIVFATGEIPAPAMARAGLVFDLVLVLLVTAVFLGWGRFVLGVGSGLPAWAGG